MTAIGAPGLFAGRERRGFRIGDSLVLATAVRVMGQTVLNVQSLAILVVLPGALISFLAWVMSEGDGFQRVGPAMLVMYPMLTVTGASAVVLLRERRSGTLERLLTLPLSRGGLVLGYVVGFAVNAAVQATATTGIVLTLTGLHVDRSIWLMVLTVTVSAVLGSVLGLVLGAVTRSELEAVQLTPALIVPQFFVAGVLVPRDHLPQVLHDAGDWLPLTHAVQAASAVADAGGVWHLGFELLAVILFTAALAGVAMCCLNRRSF